MTQIFFFSSDTKQYLCHSSEVVFVLAYV